MISQDWMKDANCIDKTEYFFTENLPKSQAHRLEIIAKSICRNCKVRSECLDYAIRNGEQYGIWGGLTAKELNIYSNNRIRTMDDGRI